jgi:hypothetical protein
MTEQLVVCFRSPELFVEPGVYLSSAHVLVERAAALGGRLISWGATVYAFAFDLDAVQDGIELALAMLRDAAPGKEHGVGISAGPLETREEPAAHTTLTWGYPLVCSAALARAARPGEVLIDPVLGAAKRGELLTVGSRVGVYGKLRLRGLLLDVKHPWRTSLAEAAGGVMRPDFVGSRARVEIDPQPGTLSIVRAARGHGGSRLLEEIEQALEPARVLHVTPYPFGEPLGALRRAMLRAVTMGQAPLNLNEHGGQSLDALLGADGLDPESTVELLTAWLTPDSVQDLRGVIILDDAGETDADTLEVVERALRAAGEPFRIVLRLDEHEAVPPALAPIPRGREIVLDALSPADATALAIAATTGHLDEKTAARWAIRGGRLPLGVVESIREAVEAGEIVLEEGRAIARQRSSGSGGARPPKHWVRRRLDYRDADCRRVLEALAVLGGQVEARDLTDVLRRRQDVQVDADTAIAVLVAAGWVQRLKPDVVALPGATHRDAILTSMDEHEFRAWHRAASEAFARRERPLATAVATVHAVLCGDAEQARELARRAGSATRAIGLERTADAFDRFAEHGEISALTGRNLFMAQLDLARAVPSVWPNAPLSSVPPSEVEPVSASGLALLVDEPTGAPAPADADALVSIDAEELAPVDTDAPVSLDAEELVPVDADEPVSLDAEELAPVDADAEAPVSIDAEELAPIDADQFVPSSPPSEVVEVRPRERRSVPPPKPPWRPSAQPSRPAGPKPRVAVPTSAPVPLPLPPLTLGSEPAAAPAPEPLAAPPEPPPAVAPEVLASPARLSHPPPAAVAAVTASLARASQPPGAAGASPMNAPWGAPSPPSAALTALRGGDLEAVERLAEHAQIDEGRPVLAERLRAMAHLARGETGDAIRRLRDAAENARRTGSRDRCRASLGLAVALSAANRPEEALFEALDALARSREMQDAKGEHACLRFLGHLAASAGHHDVAEAWAAVADG